MEIDNLKVKTYIEDEYKLAYAKARKELGHNLVIIEKKEVKEGGVFGLFGKKKVRVTFGVEVLKSNKNSRKNSSNEDQDLIKALRDVAVKHMNELKEESPPKEAFKPLVSELFNNTSKEDIGIYSPFKKEIKKSFEEIQKELKLTSQEKIIETKNIDYDEIDQIEKIRLELEKELKKAIGATITTKNIQQSKEDEFDLVDFLRENEFSKESALEVDAYFNEKGHDKKNYQLGLREYFMSIIKVKTEKSNEKFIMLIGPTGVGKTTTCAKIVANNWRNEKSVGFITADTYRLEAVSQLKAYANIMRVPIEVVNKPEELPKTMEKFRDKDVVLMDTAGRSPKNKEQMEELKSYVESKGDSMETVLVLSATSKQSVLHETIEKFEYIGFDSIIITKIDETSSVNALLSIQKKFPYPFYYITTGQSVPDDIEICTKDMLTDIFMKGIK